MIFEYIYQVFFYFYFIIVPCLFTYRIIVSIANKYIDRKGRERRNKNHYSDKNHNHYHI